MVIKRAFYVLRICEFFIEFFHPECVLNIEGVIILFEFDHSNFWLIISVLRSLSLRKDLHNVKKALVIENNFYCLKITAS